MKLIQRVKREVNVPVTTGETYNYWQSEKLATAVDFIGAHILPYWDHRTATEAVGFTLDTFDQLRQQHPRQAHRDRRVRLAERRLQSQRAEPGRLEQATVLRQFVARADALGIDYNIIEAFDQPWKTLEGSVGRYWGMFDASRQPKFAWTGPIDHADYWKIAAIGDRDRLPDLAADPRQAPPRFREAVLLAAASHVVGAWAAIVFEYWNGHYFVLGRRHRAVGSACCC